MSFFSRTNAQLEPSDRYSRFSAQMTLFSPRMVLFGIRTMSDIIWGKCAPKLPKGAWIGIILKLTYLQHYNSNSNQILYSYKEHKVLFVDGLNTRITNPRWRTAAILVKTKNCNISATVWPIATKFSTVTQYCSTLVTRRPLKTF